MSISIIRHSASIYNPRVAFLFANRHAGGNIYARNAIVGLILENVDKLKNRAAEALINSPDSIPGVTVEKYQHGNRSELLFCGRLDAIECVLNDLNIGDVAFDAIEGFGRRNFQLRLSGGSMNIGPGNSLIMGALNITPDSFSDGGKFLDYEKAVERGLEMARDGADIIDVGGESTRPGASPVTADEQIRRVTSVIKKLAAERLIVSIDTADSIVAREALDAGAQIINDVSAMRADDKMARAVAESGAPVVLMHMLGAPRNMQENPRYDDVVADIVRFLRHRIEVAVDAGIDEEQIIIDPGIGFGKTVDHNLEILRRLAEFRSLGRPILLGTSRKSFIGRLLDRPVEERLMGTASTLALGAAAGASIFRVHDAREAIQVVKMAEAIMGFQK